jgi:hypothetical protein
MAEEIQQQTTMKESLNTKTLGADPVDEEINYQAEDNWTMEHFMSYQKERILLFNNEKKTWFLGYVMKARWRGYQPEVDTMEPVHMAAWYQKMAIEYLKQV